MIIKTLIALSVGLAMPLCAFAGETAYTAADILNYFSAPAEQGLTRGICVGTPEQCGTAQPKRRPGFNLMVNFEKNSAILTEAARANLREFARALKDQRLVRASFEVDGYTDASGSASYNLSLSDRRARSVVAFLSAQGIDGSRLTPKGYGETRPLGPDPYDPINRRVETSLAIK